MNTLKFVRPVCNSYTCARAARFFQRTVPCNSQPYVAGAKRSPPYVAATSPLMSLDQQMLQRTLQPNSSLIPLQ